MTSLVERASGFLESRLSRRGFINRSAFVGSAVAIGSGLDLVLRPGTAYGQICYCGNADCDCGSTCCAGYSEFCCSVNNGYNYCPTNTIMGGWWMADNSTYCNNGPRYYMDCNAVCQCDDGCGYGWGFCDTDCDGVNCECGVDGCDSWVTGCFQFSYGQCNQNVACLGRIVCRVVACVPPWEIDPTCTTTAATDNYTAEMDVACWTPAFPTPPPPPPPPCDSPATNCQVVSMAATDDGLGYWLVTSFGKLFAFGDGASDGDLTGDTLAAPLVAMAGRAGGGYYMVGDDGGVFAFGGAGFYGSMGGIPLNAPVVGMATTATGRGYWLVAADGGIFAFGDAGFYGSMGGIPLNAPVVGMAATATGRGYWLVAADGGIFAFGDAGFYGSMGGIPLVAQVVAMAARDAGYWLVAADGGVFAFGQAGFEGSEGGQVLLQPVVGMAAPPDGRGYWLVAADGGIFSFGVPFYGSAV